MSATRLNIEGVPGSELVGKGLDDLRAHRDSIEALVVSIGAARLRAAGFDVAEPIDSPEHELYALLAERDGDGAHSAYNALIRRLVSFERVVCAS